MPTPLAGVTAIVSASQRSFDRHWHDAYGFGVLDRGAQSWRSRRGVVDAYAGAVINTVPGEVHDGRPLGGRQRHWRILSVEPAVMRSLAGHDRREVDIHTPAIDDAALARTLRVAFQRVQRRTPLAFEEAIAEACTLLVGRHGTSPVSLTEAAADVRPVRDRLADDFANTHSLGELAALVGLSRFQLVRRFRACYGLPPHAWLLSRRAERARALIRQGTPLAAAALRSGFADQSHMTRTFSRFYGYSPGQWQKACAPRP